MNEFALIGGMLLATLLTRYPMMLLVSRIEVPERLTRAFNYVPIAVLSAIITPLIFVQDDTINLGLENHFLLAAIVSALVAWRWRNLLLTILIGMAALFVFRALPPL